LTFALSRGEPSAVTNELSPNRRRVLALREKAGLNGITERLLAAHGFGGAFADGLAVLSPEQVRVGPRLIEGVKVYITRAGRDALAADDAPDSS
jgi:hypothetical protein